MEVKLKEVTEGYFNDNEDGRWIAYYLIVVSFFCLGYNNKD